MTLDERLSDAQWVLRDGHHDRLAAAVAEARDRLNAADSGAVDDLHARVESAMKALQYLMLSGVAIRPHVASEKAGVAHQAITALVNKNATLHAENTRLREQCEAQPYLTITSTVTTLAYNPTYGDERICVCGHTYYHHFDTYDNMKDVGCKYCDCETFVERT